ncbi:hypothetical protein E4U43_002954 [Claviceps pusilla]|uniref:RCC1-like domain-containing protein n=1 Tax=Claviceps pusilla TaxID=123648 RepID=A0A9P7N627_9HYPO|nr:hypothetical protein E4U43_002954 [Claviceps pusilla]
MHPKPNLDKTGLVPYSHTTSTTSLEATHPEKGTAKSNAVVQTVRSAFKSIPFVPNTSFPTWRFGGATRSWKAEFTQLFTPSARKRKRDEAADAPQQPVAPKSEALSGRAKRLKLKGSACRTPRSRPTADGPINSAPTQRLDVVVFGSGEDGELGLGSIRYERKNPAVADKPRVNHLLRAEEVGVVQVAVGGRHCAALTHDGRVLTWGVNDSRALGRNTAWERHKDIMVDKDVTDLNPLESVPLPAEGLSRLGLSITQVAATDNATFALTDSGLVYGWGTFHASDGVYGFLREKMQKRKTPDYNARFQASPVRIEGLRNIKHLSAGMNHVLALTTSGDVYAWGSGQQAQLGRRLVQRHQYESLTPRMVDLPKKGIVKIFAGVNHSFALDRHGHVWTWGLNNFGQTGIPANDENLHIGNPTMVEGLEGHAIRHIAGGFHHSLACTEEGQVLAWGRCDGGQSGMDSCALANENCLFDSRGRPRILLNPTILPGITATFVAAGIDNSLAVDKNGTVSCWGFSENYRTGLGSQKTVETPTELVGKGVVNRDFTYAGCGGQFTVMTRPHV